MVAYSVLPGALVPAPVAVIKAKDELAFDDEPAAAPTNAVQKPTAKPAAHDPLDDISFDQEPLGQAASPTGADDAKEVKKPVVRTRNPSPSGRVDNSAQPSSSKPGSGKIVRRGNRMALATTSDVPDEDADQADEQPLKPSKPLPPWVQKLKQPHQMAIIGGSFALLIVLIVLISAWSNASTAAKDFEDKAKKAEGQATTLNKDNSDIKSKLDESKSVFKAMEKTTADALAALAAAKTQLAELSEKVKQSEAQKAEEIAKRKKADNDYSEIFANQKKLEKQRDEDYQRSNDLRKKYEEEMKLRKDLQERLQTLAKEQAAAK